MQNVLNVLNVQGNQKSVVTDPQASLSREITNLPGLLAYYPLNETSGSAINRAPATYGSYNGTVSNATQGAAGSIGKAYSFDGSGDRVIVTSIAPAATFSFMLAFKRNGDADANDRMIDQASGGPTKGWHIQVDADGNLALKTWNDSGASLSLNFGVVADGEWVVIGGSIGASESKLYLNGSEVASGGGNSFGTGVTADLQFGCRSGGTSNPMSGSLQHVAIGSNVEWTPAAHAEIASFFLT